MKKRRAADRAVPGSDPQDSKVKATSLGREEVKILGPEEIAKGSFDAAVAINRCLILCKELSGYPVKASPMSIDTHHPNARNSFTISFKGESSELPVVLSGTFPDLLDSDKGGTNERAVTIHISRPKNAPSTKKKKAEQEGADLVLDFDFEGGKKFLRKFAINFRNAGDNVALEFYKVPSSSAAVRVHGQPQAVDHLFRQNPDFQAMVFDYLKTLSESFARSIDAHQEMARKQLMNGVRQSIIGSL